MSSQIYRDFSYQVSGDDRGVTEEMDLLSCPICTRTLPVEVTPTKRAVKGVYDAYFHAILCTRCATLQGEARRQTFMDRVEDQMRKARNAAIMGLRG